MQIIKAHVDIFGNELADNLAKLGASLNLDNEMVTFIHIGHYLTILAYKPPHIKSTWWFNKNPKWKIKKVKATKLINYLKNQL